MVDNWILDVTAWIHIPFKLFAIYVVAKHTSPQFRHYSYFILNSMFWSFLCNLAFTFAHLTPMFPAVCFRLDGLLSYFVDSERFGHAMYILAVFLITECSLALLFSFPHRYIVFVYPKVAARMRPVRVAVLCAGMHVFIALIYFPAVIAWTVSYDEYPNKAELPAKPFVFCFHPSGPRKTAIAVVYLMGATTGIIFGFACAIMFLLKFKRMGTQIIHGDTLALQKKVFTTLLMLSAVALFFCIPAVIFVCIALFPHTPYAREVSLVCMMFLTNHGSISAVAYLLFFKDNRVAVKRMLSNGIARLTGRNSKVHSLFVKSSPVVVSQNDNTTGV